MTRMIFAFAIAYFTLYFFGYSLKVLLLKDDLKKFDLYITPWLGICLIVSVLFPLSWLGFSVNGAARYFLYAVCALNLAVWLKTREGMIFETSEAVFIAVIALLVSFLHGFALNLAGDGVFALGINADFGRYLSNARAALYDSAANISSIPEGIPFIFQINRALNLQLRGCVFVHALFSALFRVDLAHSAYPLSAFVWFLCVITFRLFLKRALLNLRLAVPLLGILVFNAFYQRMIFEAFTGQLYAFGLLILAFYIEYYLAGLGKFDLRTCVLLVFIIVSGGLLYLEGMAFPIVPILPLLIVIFINKKYDRNACLKNAAFTAGLFLLVAFPLIKNFVSFFLYLDAVPQAWPQPLTTMEDVAGLKGAFSSLIGAAPWDAVVLVSANVVLIPVLIYQLRKEGPAAFLGASFIFFCVLHAAFCLRYFRPEKLSSYNAFKSALTLSFIPVIFLIRFMEEKLEGRWKWLAASCLACVIFMACFADYRNLKILVSVNGAKIDSEWDAIELFSDNTRYSGSDFFAQFDEAFLLHYIVYKCPEGRTYSNWHERFSVAEGRMKNSFKKGDIYITDAAYEEAAQTTDAKPAFENGVYKIFELGEDSLLLYARGGLSEDVRVESVVGEYKVLRKAGSGGPSFEFWSMSEKRSGLFVEFYSPEENADVSAEAYVNGEFLGKFSKNGDFVRMTLNDVSFKQGGNVVRFKFDGAIGDLSLSEMRFF